ncbi:GNAT family N-acetyltransferase [Streptomyces sp. H28]|uniref:GNAT family N-acetyltransferase n=1 Tax=Streptomyces sp. H28 TaxID=2775865 RepID=UPI0017816288|nr:N-acetyltransferase [Streptomyces sp. H28]MBD9730391.1 GNAT family N-acetyltransferase [Streptomyces sp. H28]
MVHMRPMRESDLAALARLDEELFPDWAYPYFVLRQLHDLCGARMLVLDDDGDGLVGYAVAARTSDGRRGWVLALGVTRGARGCGWGRELLRACVDGLREDGAEEIRLTVEPANDSALALYRSLGFTEVERRADYYGRGADRLVLALAPPRP